MTHLTIEGNFSINYVESALLEVFLLWKIPINIEEILVIDDPKYYSIIEHRIPKEIRREFREAYKEDPTSMSLTWRTFDLIIISISKKDEMYLKKNKKSLTGLFAHELMHVYLRRKGLDTQIRKDAVTAFRKFSPKLKKLKQYKVKELEELYSTIGRTADFVLKDLYANSKLIDLDLGEYILEDYRNLYSKKKGCPVNLFPYKLKKHEGSLKKITQAFVFELELLPAIIPFIRMYKLKKTKRKEVKEFINFLSKCYETNVSEVAKTYTNLINFSAEKIKDTPQFRQKFYSMLFNNVYRLIK